jgi:hypothetical protein
MASKKPAAKPAKKTKKITAKLLPKTRSPKKMAARKSKPSKAKRYAGRGEKREAWAKKNPGMIPGELGKPARPDKMADSDAVAKAALERAAEQEGVTPDEILEKATKQAKELGLVDNVEVSDSMTVGDKKAVDESFVAPEDK